MALIADSGGIYGLYDKRDAAHLALRRAVEREHQRIVIPAIVLGEVDYLMRVRIGVAALLELLADIERGAFEMEGITLSDLGRCEVLLTKYADLDLGLCDAAVIAVAERLGTDRILTVDERDFRAVRSASGKPFRLFPAEYRRR